MINLAPHLARALLTICVVSQCEAQTPNGVQQERWGEVGPTADENPSTALSKPALRQTLIELQTARATSDPSLVSAASIAKRRGLFQRRGKVDVFIQRDPKR